MIKRCIYRGASAHWVGVALAATMHASWAQVRTDADDTIAEITVTAAKRETSLEKTPQAITALNGDIQHDRGQTGLDDLKLSVPNVNFSYTSNQSQLYIRGIGNTFLTAGGDPGVAFYQDDAYVSDQRSTNSSMFDVDHIEILRGPQGALYGRNAVGGAINMLSAKPTDAFHASVGALIGDFGRYESEGYISGPLGHLDTDARVSYQVKYFDGYTINKNADHPGAPNRLDDLDSQAFRAQTLTTLPSDGILRFIVGFYHEADNGAALGVKPRPGISYPAQAIYGEVPSADPRAVRVNVGSNYLEVSTVNVSFVQPLGGNTLTVLGNYRDGVQTFLNDCDGTPADTCEYFLHTSGQDYYGDVHLASADTSRLRWLVGATALHFNQSQYIHVPEIALATYADPTAAADAPYPIDVKQGGQILTKSSAAYLDLHFQLNSIFAATGQVRYSETTKHASQFQIVPQFGVGVTNDPASLKNTSTPFKVGLEGQLTPDALVYLSYATAHKDGAINLGALQTTPVKQEELKSVELGAKATFFERTLQINAALFDSKYDDLQISQIVGNTVALANAPRAKIRGAELELIMLPLSGLQLSINGGYLDAKFVEFSNSKVMPGFVNGPLQNLAGHELPYVSPFTVNLDAVYKFALHDRNVKLDLQYAWHNRVYFNEFNDRDNSQGPVGLLNLSASISPEAGRWNLYGYAHNLNNNTVISGTTIYSGALGATKAVSYEPPRLFGIGAAYSF
jgi:iron complex outermembrane receptor protein